MLLLWIIHTMKTVKRERRNFSTLHPGFEKLHIQWPLFSWGREAETQRNKCFQKYPYTGEGKVVTFSNSKYLLVSVVFTFPPHKVRSNLFFFFFLIFKQILPTLAPLALSSASGPLCGVYECNVCINVRSYILTSMLDLVTWISIFISRASEGTMLFGSWESLTLQHTAPAVTQQTSQKVFGFNLSWQKNLSGV